MTQLRPIPASRLSKIRNQSLVGLRAGQCLLVGSQALKRQYLLIKAMALRGWWCAAVPPGLARSLKLEADAAGGC